MIERIMFGIKFSASVLILIAVLAVVFVGVTKFYRKLRIKYDKITTEKLSKKQKSILDTVMVILGAFVFFTFCGALLRS